MTAPHRAEKTAATFRQSCSIRCEIKAAPARIWALLTDAGRFPSWNSTVSKIEGDIALGQKLAVQVPAAPGRTFALKVTQLDAGKSMEWSSGFGPMFKAVRTFTLADKGSGVTEFTMTEIITGLMLPMIKGSLPDFGPMFEAYAADLARAAEGGAQ